MHYSIMLFDLNHIQALITLDEFQVGESPVLCGGIKWT